MRERESDRETMKREEKGKESQEKRGENKMGGEERGKKYDGLKKSSYWPLMGYQIPSVQL